LSTPAAGPSVAAMTSPERVWLITGSSSGFGRHLAEAAVAHGDRVVATARRPASLDELVAIDPERVHAVALDVTDAEQIAAAVAAALDRFGRIDVLVNNAGNGSVGAVEELELDHLRGLMETMFFGPVALVQAVLPHMRERRSGAIVQMSSMGGQTAFPGFGAYCAAKFALEGLSEALAAEVAPHGIRVLIPEPGAFRTGFAGAGLHQSDALDAYADTVGQTRAFITAMDGKQPGDPAKAAAAILAALDAPEPLRLALGADAVDALHDELDRRRKDLDGYEDVSRAAVFD
jgi:NAD(P)-dependent dehydrogenase (short-subunit alcohol dehydrogenase family)